MGLHRGEDPSKSRGIGQSRANAQCAGDRKIPGFLAAAGAEEDPDVGRAARTRGGIRRVWARRAVVVHGVMRDKEPRLLKDRTNASPVVGGTMNHRLWWVAESPPQPHTRAWSLHLSMTWSHRVRFCVLGPNRHAEWADPKQRCRNVRLERIRESKKPRTCSRDAVETGALPDGARETQDQAGDDKPWPSF